MKKRVYDVAGTTCKTLKVFYNGKQLKINSFKEYMQLHRPEGNDTPFLSTKVNDRWEVGVGVTDGHFQQVSFVNNINTMKGGSHVTMVGDQITKKLLEQINKKNKALQLKGHHVKNHVFIFVNALIENPAFDSQTKVNLTCNKKTFGSKCEIDEKFMKQVAKSGIIANVLSMAKFKAKKALGKNDGKKKTKLLGIDKLDDANDAGGRNSSDCTLILTEGDSAKALAVSGLSVVGRDKYGVFPLKGKLLNVRDAATTTIMKNAEISNLKQIIGLKQGVEYADTKSLRYGHVMIMTDQDQDGSHIKGLVINMFATFWPSLLRLPGFLTEFITPIVRCSKGKKSKEFYTLPEYEAWKEGHDDGKGYKIKYYKGLGTSTSQEAKVYFSDLVKHKIEFEYKDDKCDDAIDLAFNKKKADDRKAWMAAMAPGTYLDQNVEKVSFQDFVHKELILFSMASNVRAIPSVVDGFKPGQRKILFACLKKKLKNEIKVAQLAGYVSEQAAYHHGEMSLTSTIVGLAQNYVGSNNVNLLVPAGQFGTRLQGGKDAASARYIFTHLSPIAQTIFKEEDAALLEFGNEDGQSIEPQFYLPVIPMVLANGSNGIGTGWSSTVPNYNPRDLVAQVQRLLQGEELAEMRPWYNGFKGQVLPNGENSYVLTGSVRQTSPTTLVIDELPVGTWTSSYKSFLEEMMVKGTVSDVREYHTDSTVCFEVTMPEDKLVALVKAGAMKELKLTSTISTGNMVLFNADNQLKKYATANDIVRDYFELRLDGYVRRKQAILDKLTHELLRLQNRSRFIEAVLSDELNMRNRKKRDLLNELADSGYNAFPRNAAKKSDDDVAEDSDDDDDVAADGYDYLLSMPLLSLTKEKVSKLSRERKAKEEELDILMAKTPKDLWNEDLDDFLEKLDAHDELMAEAAAGDKRLCNNKKKKTYDEDSDFDDEEEWGAKKKKKKGKEKKVQLAPTVNTDFTPIHFDYRVKTPKKKRAKKGAAAATAVTAAAQSVTSAMVMDNATAQLTAMATTMAAKKPAAKRAPAKKAAPKKKKKQAWSDNESNDEQSDDDFDSDMDADDAASPMPSRTPRRKRTTARTNYAAMEESGDEEMTDDDDNDDEDGESDDDDDDDDDDDEEEDDEPTPAPKKKLVAKQAVAKKAPVKAAAAPVEEEKKPEVDMSKLSLSERLALMTGGSSSISLTSITSALSTSTITAPAVAAKKPAAKRAPAKKKATAKDTAAFDFDEDDDHLSPVKKTAAKKTKMAPTPADAASPNPAPTKRHRVAAVKYAESDDDSDGESGSDDDSEEESEEESESEFESEEEDDESDYSE
jgi:DNA topoisomerase-2